LPGVSGFILLSFKVFSAFILDESTRHTGVIFVVPAAGAYVSVYLNEKIAGGSIVPGWISHASANVLSYSIVGFLM